MSKVFKRMQAMFLAVIMIVGVLPTVSQADDVGAKFKNGPYLLAPKEHSMVVVWESTENVPSTIAYGTDKEALCDPISVNVNEDAPDFQGTKMNLFHYKLDNLEAGTRYYYEVKLENGETCSAS